MTIQALYDAVSEWVRRLSDRLTWGFDGYGSIPVCSGGVIAVPATVGAFSERARPSVQFAEKPEGGSDSTAASPELSGSGSTKKNSLKDKVNSIMSVADEDEEDAELLEELSKPKKKFFGLFG